MPRTALGLIIAGLVAVVCTLTLVLGEATLPGRLPPQAAAMLAAAGGAFLTLGLWLLEDRGRQQLGEARQQLS
jgi:hypothetical protein